MKKKKDLSLKEKLRQKPCPMCGKKMWKFKSVSKGSGQGGTQKWWECRGCGYKQYFV
jgi:RNase P subunit RPR2